MVEAIVVEGAPAPSSLDPALIGAIIPQGVGFVRRMLLPAGEVPSYRYSDTNKLEYCTSPFVSTFVHDALGYFDPRCPWVEPRTVELVPAEYRHAFVREVVGVRKRIRAYLAWQEEAGHVWRFFGRNSGIDPDVDTTACAATILLESRIFSPVSGQRHVEAIRRFRAAEGRYFSYVHHDGRGYTWMDPEGRPILGFDRVVNANVLRFFALVGSDTRELTDYLMEELGRGDFANGSPDYPNPLCFGSMLARAWRQGLLPGRAALAEALLPQVLSFQRNDGDFGGPLSTAMALGTMLDLDYAGPARGRACQALLGHMQSLGAWEYEDFFVQGFGSPAWTTALATAVLARHAVAELPDDIPDTLVLREEYGMAVPIES